MSRTRETWPARELPHIWAHRKAEYGRAGNISFNGDVFRSYHTAIAQLVRMKGHEFVLVNNGSYSNSTAKHQHKMRQAISHMTQISVPHVQQGKDYILPSDKREHRRVFREIETWLIAQAGASMLKAKRARSYKDQHITDAKDYLKQAEFLAQLYGRHVSQDLGVAEETVQRAAKLEAARERREQRQAEKDNAEKVRDWLAGVPGAHWPSAVCTVHLRSRKLRMVDTDLVGTTEKDTMHKEIHLIETTLGVTIPYDEAQRQWVTVMRMRASKKWWHRNGEQMPIGRYQLDAVNEFGVVAGCHKIAWKQLEELGEREGWAVPA